MFLHLVKYICSLAVLPLDEMSESMWPILATVGRVKKSNDVFPAFDLSGMFALSGSRFSLQS